MNIDILSNDQLALMDQLISDAQTVLVVCHKSPDGDAIGSSLAWAEFLRHRGKDVTVMVPDQYPDFFKWLPNTDKIVRYDKHPDKGDMLLKIADLVFCLDFNTPSRVDEMAQPLVDSPAKKVLIDHHLKPDVPADLIVSHPDASSTSELVFRIAWQMGDFNMLDKAFAVPVYCGMMTDTGGFTYNSSRPEIYFIIGELLTKRIDKDRIYRNVFHNYSENRIRLMGYVMYEKLVYMPEYHAAFYSLTRDELKRFNYVKGDSEGLVNIPQQIKDLKLSISLREDTDKPNLVWVSLRSVDDFPCNLMAEEFFNGGGHLNASGGRVDGTIEDAIEIAKKAIIAYQNKLK